MPSFFFNFTAETHKCSKIEPEALYIIIIITKNNSIFVVYGEKKLAQKKRNRECVESLFFPLVHIHILVETLQC